MYIRSLGSWCVILILTFSLNHSACIGRHINTCIILHVNINHADRFVVCMHASIVFNSSYVNQNVYVFIYDVK